MSECPICGGTGCRTYPLMLERWAAGRDREHWRRIHDRINGPLVEYPPLPVQARSLAASLWTWARTGFRLANPITRARRRAICRACPVFVADAQRCGRCGCSIRIKPWLNSAACPEGRW